MTGLMGNNSDEKDDDTYLNANINIVNNKID